MLKAPKKNHEQWEEACYRACFAYADEISALPDFAVLLRLDDAVRIAKEQIG